MFEKITNFANENNFKYIIDGTNYDDINTYRPGLKALEEFKIISPFKNFKITKKEIRNYLENINKKYSQNHPALVLQQDFPMAQIWIVIK